MARPLWALLPRGSAPAPSICSASLSAISEFRRANVHMLAHPSGAEPAIDLPLDLRATGFQWRVWQELRRIPRGATASYQAIAAAIGQPKAVRAVANACANNRVALVIPCHRVIREDGKLGGYRWGVERKEKLLATERTK